MNDIILTEAEVRERIGLRTLDPLVVPSRARRVNLRRFKLGNTTFLHRGDILKLLTTESEQLGGDPVLDKLASLIMEVTS